MRTLLFVVGFLLMAGASQAQEAWKLGTGANDTACSRGVGPGTTCFWSFNNDQTDSPVLRISAEYATVCFDPNTAAATLADTVEVMQVIGDDCSTTTGSANTSEPVNNGTVTTLTGDSATSADCVYEVPTGCIWINPSGTVAAVDAVVKVTGAPGDRQ